MSFSNTMANCRSFLKTTLEGISGIEKVYDYQPNVNVDSTFRTKFKDSNDIIHAYTITRRSSRNRIDVDDGEYLYPTFQRSYQFIIRGYYGVDEDNTSEKTFQDEVETILNTLDVLPNLGGNCAYCEPPEVLEVGHRMFGNALCHYCEMSLVAYMRRVRTS